MSIPHVQSESPTQEVVRPETATVQQTPGSGEIPAGQRDRMEVDAGVVLFGIVLLLLLGIPFSFAMLRFRVAGRRPGASALHEGRIRSTKMGPEAPVDPRKDPWQEAARRVDIDSGSIGDEVR